MVCELERALTSGDVDTARQLSLDPTFRTLSMAEQTELLSPLLFECCELGLAASVSLLLDDLSIPVDVRLPGDQSTPLHVAAKHAQPAVVETLLRARADPEARMRHQITPLLFSCDLAAGLDVARLLLAHLLQVGPPHPRASPHEGD